MTAKALAAPVTISDASAPVLVGLSARQFRAALRTLAVPHVKVGRRTVCRADAWLAAIDRVSGVATDNASGPWDEDAAIAAAVRGSR